MRKKRRTMTYPKLWKRVLAFILDLLLINIVVVAPFHGLLSGMVPDMLSFSSQLDFLRGNQEVLTFISIIFGFAAIISLFYFALLEYTIGASIGKLVLNLKVVRAEGELGLSHCLIRSIYLIPFFPFSFIWIIDIGYFLFFGRVQRFTEYLSKTYVIEGDA